MLTELDGLIEQYVSALKRALADVTSALDRSDYAEHLSAAGEMQEAIAKGDLARACSIASAEEHVIGWRQLSGQGGRAAQELFRRLVKAVLVERLRGAADAGFGHGHQRPPSN
jgi:hypothetical protein